jgi:hypothetical protein
VLKAFLLFLGLAFVLGAIGLTVFINCGVSAKETSGRAEEFVARRVRNMAIARQAKAAGRPLGNAHVTWRLPESLGTPHAHAHATLHSDNHSNNALSRQQGRNPAPGLARRGTAFAL